MGKTIVKFDHVSYTYPGWKEWLLEDVSFTIGEGERIGLLGYNGSGKTTLLGLVSGDQEPAKGTIERTGADMFFFKQKDYARCGETVFNYLMSSRSDLSRIREQIRGMEERGQTGGLGYADRIDEYREKGGYAIEQIMEKTVSVFGFPPGVMGRAVNTLSGGERRLLKLASGFIADKKLYLLDEPTNYLDDQGIAFLSRAIAFSGAAFLIVSHDRWFLDQTVKKMLEVESRTVRAYPGNYTIFIRTKENEIKTRLRKKARIESEIKKLKDIERTYKIWGYRKEKQVKSAADRGYVSHQAAKLMKRAIQARARVTKRIDDLEKAKPHIEKYYDFHFEDTSLRKQAVLCANGLTKTIGGRVLFKDISFTIDGGEKVALVGPNGSGKTTLIRILLGRERCDAGEVVWSRRSRYSYLAQEWEPELDRLMVADLFDDDEAERARVLIGVLKVMQMGNVFDKKIGNLSEGQKRKIKLVKIILQEPEILVLDEPTTHLDYQTVEFLEQALREFDGSLILVSHDRLLRERVTTRAISIG